MKVTTSPQAHCSAAPRRVQSCLLVAGGVSGPDIPHLGDTSLEQRGSATTPDPHRWSFPLRPSLATQKDQPVPLSGLLIQGLQALTPTERTQIQRSSSSSNASLKVTKPSPAPLPHPTPLMHLAGPPLP